VKVLFIARSTLYKDKGGDTVQVLRTADHLRSAGVEVVVKLTTDHIDYEAYDLLHFFNIIRPADILRHIRLSGKPYVVSTIFVDYSEYERKARGGFTGLLSHVVSSDRIEYMKVVARCLVNGEKIVSPSYLFYGQRNSIRKIIRGAAMLLPNSLSEYNRLYAHYRQQQRYTVIPNAIDPRLFRSPAVPPERDGRLVICVGRIEGRKNQLNLIRALKGSLYQLIIIGSPSANQSGYYEECKKTADRNVSFVAATDQETLLDYYLRAKVHVLASWFETTGLSSLEAAAMGCNLVITDKGDTREYFGNDAWYCDPDSLSSIREAIEQAANATSGGPLQNKIFAEYTWTNTAEKTAGAYRAVLGK
jgi:glycosyltransferase involved in cell wall biosynthesis